MRTRDLKMTILKMFGGREFYGYEVHKKLVSEDVKIEISRLYRVLTEMLREGLLESRWEKSQLGPRKRVYQLGKKGKVELDRILLDAIKIVHSFYGKYLASLPPKDDPVSSLCNLLTNGLKGQMNIGYITTSFSPMHERVIHTLRKNVPEGKIYLVKPSSVMVKLKLDNLLFLDGSHNNIPMKDGYFDLMVVIDLPEKELLEPTLKELHRVSNQNGRVVILTPSVLVQKHKDPMTIGDFVERYEHVTIEKGEYVNLDFLQNLLRNLFKKVDEKQIVHMAIILASKPRSQN